MRVPNRVQEPPLPGQRAHTCWLCFRDLVVLFLFSYLQRFFQKPRIHPEMLLGVVTLEG